MSFGSLRGSALPPSLEDEDAFIDEIQRAIVHASTENPTQSTLSTRLPTYHSPATYSSVKTPTKPTSHTPRASTHASPPPDGLGRDLDM